MKKYSILFNLLAAIFCIASLPLSAANPYIRRNACAQSSLCDGTITVGADWLYWKVTEDNLLVGSFNTVTSAPGSLPQDVQSAPITQKFKWESGFRANLGYELPGGCWDLNVTYTYLPSRSTSAAFTSTNPNINQINPNFTDFPILSSLNSNGFVLPPTFINAKWNLTANNIDVDLGRTVCFGECIKIRPHVGFRTLWFDQKLRYNSGAIISGNPLQQSFIAKFSEKFTGCGVEGGLWGEWEMGCGLSLIGHFGGSILYSKFRIHEEAVASNVTVVPEILSDTRSCTFFRNGTPTVDYFIGLQYENCWCDLQFSIHAGWEQHIIFDVNRLARDGNLSAQGLTLGGDLAF